MLEVECARRERLLRLHPGLTDHSGRGPRSGRQVVGGNSHAHCMQQENVVIEEHGAIRPSNVNLGSTTRAGWDSGKVT